MSESQRAAGADAGGAGEAEETPETGTGTETEAEAEAETGTPEGAGAADPQAITRRPATLSGTLAILSAAAVALLAAVFSLPGVAAAGFGLAALAVGVAYGRRRVVDLGGLALVAGTVLIGLSNLEPVTLLAAVGSVLAWDLGNNAIGIGEQLGREADTQRVELLHAGATLAVGLLTAGTSYVVYRAASGGQPVTAVFFLLLAAVALISSLRL